MSENKTLELKDEDLAKVSGGGSGTYNGVTYSDGDVFCYKDELFTSTSYPIFIIKNCTCDSVDIDWYSYNSDTKVATFNNPYYMGASYAVLTNLKKIDIEILQFN